jgi:hypothetical protein
MAGQALIAAAIIIAAIIIVIGYGYFHSNPSVLATTSTTNTTTKITPYLNGVSPNISASCTYDNNTYHITCTGVGDTNTTSWNVSLRSAYPGNINYLFDTESFTKDIGQFGNGVGYSTKNATLKIIIQQKQDGSYIAGSYCLKAYALGYPIVLNPISC